MSKSVSTAEEFMKLQRLRDNREYALYSKHSTHPHDVKRPKPFEIQLSKNCSVSILTKQKKIMRFVS